MEEKKHKKKIDIATIVVFLILVIDVAVIYIQYVWGILTSFKSNLDFRYNPFGLPSVWEWSNYAKVFEKFFTTYTDVEAGYTQTFYFGDMLFNSVVYALVAPMVPTIVTYMLAYCRNRYNFSALRILDVCVYVAMALPIYGTLASSIQVFRFFNIMNNFLAFVTIAQMGGWLGMNYFIMGSMVKSIPKAFVEAAEIDGAGEIQILFKVMLPLTMSVILTIYVLSVISAWNEWQTPLIYLRNMPTAAYGIYVVKNKSGDVSRVQYKLAACFMLVAPILIVFVIFHDKIMRGVSLNSGVKE